MISPTPTPTPVPAPAPADPLAGGPPWTVGFYGPFRVLTFLDDDEREIDIDDRTAILNIKIEMQPTGALPLKATDVVVTLFFNFSDEELTPGGPVAKERDNILFNDLERGPMELVTLTDNVTISPTIPLERQVTIKTGFFSAPIGSGDQPGPAVPGRKTVDVRIDFKLVPEVADARDRTTATATMQFVVAED